MRTCLAALAVATVAAPLAVGSPASAARSTDFFVVNTNASTGSPIVDSGGVFAGCTTVDDLWGAGDQIGPNRHVFFGDKRVNCGATWIDLHYVAQLNGSGKFTDGDWFVIDSNVPGGLEGGGTLRGDSRHCTPAPGGSFCILDTFTGTVG